MTEKLNITGETILAGARAAAKKTPARRTRKPSPAETAEKALAEKAGVVKKAPAKKVAPAHVTKQAAEVKAMKPAAKKVAEKEPRQKVTFDSKDWTYLQDKDPSTLHVTLAKLVEQRADIEITAKQVQAVLSMHPLFQRSEHNKSRPDYVALDETIVHQRSVHMVQAHKDAAEEIAKRPAAKKAPAKRVAKKTAPAPK